MKEKEFSREKDQPKQLIRRTLNFRQRRKNFFPTLLLAILFWLGWSLILFKVPPENLLSILGFFSLLFATLFLTSALLFANSRRGLITALFFVLVLIFRYYQIGNFLNLMILLAIFVALELFFSKQ
ncbi:hypothetical protein A2Z41_00735 [Microgenomates group bacterium RBG_19FT_COMBO_39_10]|nr:MAG: hypothetical protein A2Z41_00735 [Microgenomates group bacterium RBG_19FT_COMBO_39_10]